MEFMVCGTAWFCVLSMYLLFIFLDTWTQSRDCTSYRPRLDYQKTPKSPYHTVCYGMVGAKPTAVNTESLPEFRAHKGVPFQLHCAELTSATQWRLGFTGCCRHQNASAPLTKPAFVRECF